MTLTGAPNFRDIGGKKSVSGRIVRSGLVYRSEAVLDPTEADARLLAEADIRLVCDLRSDQERHHAPNAWWAARGVELLDLDVLSDIQDGAGAWTTLREDPTERGAHQVMHEIYRGLPAAAAPHLATIFARIAMGDLPLLIHCTAGKDRTGFLCAMILAVLDVPFDAIATDYMASAGRANAQVVDHTRRMILDRAGPDISEAAIMSLIGVNPSYLESSFAQIATDHGSVEGYITQAIGLEATTLDAVRDRLLV